MALVIPRSRTIDLGGGQSGTRVRLYEDMSKQSIEDIRTMLRQIAVRDTEQQKAIGNPPQFWETDGQTGKPIGEAQRRVVVVFGVVLVAAAMRLIEAALEQAIRATSTAHTGALADISGHWGWTFVGAGGARRVTSANPPAAMTITDRLILMPLEVPYATNVNQAADGRLGKRRSVEAPALTRRRRVKRAGAKAKGSAVGFLEAATASLRGRAEFKQFSIYASFTQRHKVTGERSKMQGSPLIVIRPRLRALVTR